MEIKEEKQAMKIVENEQPTQQQQHHSTKKRRNIFKIGFTWRPVPSILSTTLCFTITGVVFLVIGIILLLYSRKIKELEIRYDDIPECKQALQNVTNKQCQIQIELTEDFKGPVMVYYQLNNFYQNHRRYLKSKSVSQLKGKIRTVDDIKDECEPVIRNSDLWKTTSIDDTPLDPNAPANPCGLIARSFFNDSYLLTSDETGLLVLDINPKNISWKSDRNGRYRRPKNAEKIQWMDVEDERFMVWMRPAGLPDFRKLWGRIEQDLVKGKYYLKITNNYHVESFNGKKSFVLSTVNTFGGDNTFLAIVYLVVGGVSICAGIAFWIGYWKFNNVRKSKLN